MISFHAIPTFYICLYYFCRCSGNDNIRLSKALVDCGIGSNTDVVGYLDVAKYYSTQTDIYVVADTRSLAVCAPIFTPTCMRQFSPIFVCGLTMILPLCGSDRPEPSTLIGMEKPNFTEIFLNLYLDNNQCITTPHIDVFLDILTILQPTQSLDELPLITREKELPDFCL